MKTCNRPGCSTVIESPRARQKFCSPNCRKRAHEERRIRRILRQAEEAHRRVTENIIEEHVG